MEKFSLRNHRLISHVKALIKLSFPVIFGQLGMMLMILVDTLMVSPLGTEAIAAVGIGNTIFTCVLLFTSGALMGTEALCSYAMGEKNEKKALHWLIQSCYLALLLSILGKVLLWFISSNLKILQVSPELVAPTQHFLDSLTLSLLPTLLFFNFRQYLASKNKVGFTTFAVFFANIINYLLNKWLILGNSFFIARGIVGSANSTTYTRYLLFAALLFYTLKQEKIFSLKETPKLSSIKEILKLGLPIGFQFIARAGIFPVLGILVATLGATESAAHTIVVNLGSFFLTIPIGLATSSCILVSQHRGAKEDSIAKEVGSTAIALGAILMGVIAFLISIYRENLILLFTSDHSVLSIASPLLLLLSSFQILDCIQMIAAGSLRGFNDTKSAFYSNLIAFWGICLPIGWVLGIWAGGRTLGIWSGFLLGLAIAAFILIRKWRQTFQGGFV